jgi:ATP-binding cassette subfamily B protein
MGDLGHEPDAVAGAHGGGQPEPGVDPVLELEDVRFAYEGREETLKGLSFAVRRGETMAIAGESGPGKSTVFKLLEGFYAPDAGKVKMMGRDVSRVDLRA